MDRNVVSPCTDCRCSTWLLLYVAARQTKSGVYTRLISVIEAEMNVCSNTEWMFVTSQEPQQISHSSSPDLPQWPVIRLTSAWS
jgi:hypothetical protein